VHALVRELVGEEDPGLAVEELSGDDYQIAAVVEAAQTPPFLTARRVVVARDVGRFSTDELRVLVEYLGDPLPTTSVVLVARGGPRDGRPPRARGGRAVPRLGRRGPAVGPHRRDRRRRRRARAGPTPAGARERRPAPARGDGDLAGPLRPHPAAGGVRDRRRR